jgi:myo-inositol-1(or 4)-monophosphatase
MALQGKSAGLTDDALLETCVAAAKSAAEIISSAVATRSSLLWEEKSGSDFVSAVDRAAESSIARAISVSHPAAKVIGEELTPGEPLDADLAFIVDPLDGTTNFLHGYPEYAVSIAAISNGVPRAGVVLNVTNGETFTAMAGKGAALNGKPIGVSTLAQPSRALIGTGFPFKNHEKLPLYLCQFDSVMRRTAGIRRAGSAALDLCGVACGRFDAFWELDLAPWDVAAGVLIVREAGGIVTDLAGRDAKISFGGFVAGNPSIHSWLLETIRTATP